MYENIYTCNEEVNGKSVWIIFKPNFREAVTLYNGEGKILSDGEIRMEGELVLKGTRSEFPDVYTAESAQWLLEDDGYGLILFVTERTKEIKTPLGEEWNKEFNRLLKKCQKDYWSKKKEEVRLYFYDAEKNKLELCYTDIGYSYNAEYKYSLKRLLPINPFCAIDKRYTEPEKSCFILGRVRKTIGLKNSKLMDFIEPVNIIKLDFEKQDWDYRDYAYKEDKDNLESKLFDLLKFNIAKRHDSLEVMRIRAYFQNYTAEDVKIVSQFKKQIQESFKRGKAEELRNLSNILENKQNCTNAKFQLKLEHELECSSSDRIDIYFENGETDYMPADWVFDNINRCTDAKGIYLGNVRNRYSFY